MVWEQISSSERHKHEKNSGKKTGQSPFWKTKISYHTLDRTRPNLLTPHKTNMLSVDRCITVSKVMERTFVPVLLKFVNRIC